MRVQGWEGLLDEHIQSAKPFAWGENDCALWCGDWILKATERDITEEWRGKYSSEDTLQTALAEAGYQSVEAIADSAGFDIIAVSYARRGDIVMHPHGYLGICNGMFSFFIMERGVTRIDTLRCIKAWKVE